MVARKGWEKLWEEISLPSVLPVCFLMLPILLLCIGLYEQGPEGPQSTLQPPEPRSPRSKSDVHGGANGGATDDSGHVAVPNGKSTLYGLRAEAEESFNGHWPFFPFALTVQKQQRVLRVVPTVAALGSLWLACRPNHTARRSRNERCSCIPTTGLVGTAICTYTIPHLYTAPTFTPASACLSWRWQGARCKVQVANLTCTMVDVC